jgi:hypothetical protein
LELVTVFPLSPMPAIRSRYFRRTELLDGERGRFTVETRHRGEVVRELVDLHRGCAVTVKSVASTWKFLPQRRTVVRAEDVLDLVIHTGDEEHPIKVASANFSLNAEQVLADDGGFRVRFDLVGRGFLERLRNFRQQEKSESLESQFTYRHVELPDLMFGGYGELRMKGHGGEVEFVVAEDKYGRTPVMDTVEQLMLDFPPFSSTSALGQFAVFTGRAREYGYLAKLRHGNEHSVSRDDEDEQT